MLPEEVVVVSDAPPAGQRARDGSDVCFVGVGEPLARFAWSEEWGWGEGCCWVDVVEGPTA